MFVFSVRASKIKIIGIITGSIIMILLLASIITVLSNHTSAEKLSAPTLVAQTNEDRIKFLKQFGWEVNTEPLGIKEIAIPTEFNDVYEKYNIIQKKQGFDLVLYKGKKVKLWTYEVKNYPNHPNNVHANIIVSDGKIIGGDISSVEIDGFMHGYKLE